MNLGEKKKKKSTRLTKLKNSKANTRSALGVETEIHFVFAQHI